MNKQIDDMAKAICHTPNCKLKKANEPCYKYCKAYIYAFRATNAGYRKQIEGEWKQTTEPLGAHDVDCVECSVCGESWVLDEEFDFDVVNDFWYFCPNCGAQMKGDEGK